ncbi:pilus assembly protein PilY [Psychrobacter alimentarius]|uniref:pilus assembly protein PilY n=1 Tax=Psychrobacter alimentarius TaxID=261164 RepID=UPI003FCF71EB
MRHFDKPVAATDMKASSIKYLVVVASIMAIPGAQADVAGKKIGDLEIYKAAEGGKTTITMMLDTSGSMTLNQVNNATTCDLPADTNYTKGFENSNTVPVYRKDYCETPSTKKYFYRRYSIPFVSTTWYLCSNDASGSTNKNSCNIETTAPSTTSGYTPEDERALGLGSIYYYKNVSGDRYYDRLTRLKDAIFTLMDNTQLDAKKVAIGIGQFSSQSGSNNLVELNANGTAKNADGSSGKILVPADLLNDAQRTKIKNAVAAAGGGNGTPTANAYAEVGAYMLGKNTSAVYSSSREEYIKVDSTNRYYQCTEWNNSGLSCSRYNTGSFITTTAGSTSAPCQNNNAFTCLSRDYNTKTAEELGYSGFSKSVTASKSLPNYISPLSSPSSCDGRGIYFLTDGEPNASPAPLPLMRAALGSSSFSIPSVTLPSGSLPDNGMPEVGAFAKALRDPTINPLGTDREIYTAVVGFGSVFNVDREEDALKPTADRIILNLPYTNPKTGITANRDFYNCENITNKDARNACNWGEKAHPSLANVGGYGEGGFYSAQSTEDIVKSITAFVADLNQTLPSTPSGTIIIPDDPYRADSQLAVAYYPTIQPKVADNAVIWEGNMKKYRLNEGTLFGKGDNKLFKNVAGELNPAAQDLWSDTNYSGANDKVESGGFYSQLNTPATGITSIRTLYVEDWKNKTDQSPVLKKVSVSNAGKVLVNNAVLTDASFNDTAVYNQTTLRKLLNFLGFGNLPATNVKDMTLTTANVTQPIKVVGATIHSTPASVSYSATLDDDGRVTATRNDYVLFGSTEGGLHLVNASDSGANDGGKEKFVIIPKEMLRDTSKSDALIKGATKADIGSPNFGIDAPWLVSADYKYDFDNKRVNIDTSGNKGLYAYGGLRMGGEAFYGLNLNDSDSPSMMFTITPTTTGFTRMGQIWSKPTKAKIKTSTTDTGTDVLVFGGGYDMCYENEGFQVGVTDTVLGACSNVSSTKGNAVYIINAKTGALIWSASSNGSPSTTVSTMTNSIVAGVTTLDRDNDGFMDHIYFADLGGQVFRADFTNAGFVKPSATTTASSPESAFTNTRVTRVLQGAYTGTDTKYNHRFYERPVVSFYRNPTTNTLFALVNAISGDRSSPLSKIRDLNKADRLYGIIDSDVTKPDNVFYANNFAATNNASGQKVVNLTANSTAASNLMELPSAASYTQTQKSALISTLQSSTKQGWYYPLTRFDGYGNVRYTKGMGKSAVVDSFLYTTVYNPDMNYGTVDSCSARITGGSERQLYCLPYGICLDEASNNGTGGFVRAGKGIQELTLGPRSSALSNQRLLIGTRTLAERASDRVGFSSDTDKGLFNAITKPNGLNQSLTAGDMILGSGSAPDLIFNDRFILQPKTWYEAD